MNVHRNSKNDRAGARPARGCRAWVALIALAVLLGIAGCGSPPGGDGLEPNEVGRLLEGTWDCEGTGAGSPPTARQEVMFALDPADRSRGTYATQPGGAGTWSIRESRREGDGSYFVAVQMKPHRMPSAGGGARSERDQSGEWLLALTANRSFVRGVDGVMLTYHRQP